MQRNLKALGLALGAVLMLGALFASGASAAGERFHTEKESVILTGESAAANFRVGANSTKEGVTTHCKQSKYEGTKKSEELNGSTWTSKEVTVHPVYKECEAGALGEAVVTTNGCDYILTSERNGEHAPVSVECTAGAFIKIAASGCTITIGTKGAANGSVLEETLTKGVAYTNEDETVRVKATVDSIPYSSAGFLCAFGGIAAEGHDGFYEDNLLVEAREDKKTCIVNSTTHVLEGCEEGREVEISWG